MTNTHPRTVTLQHILLLYLLGMPLAYFLTGYLTNFHLRPFYFVFFSLFFQLACGTLSILFLNSKTAELLRNWREHWITLFVLLAASGMAVAAVVISWQFPGLFDRRIIFMEADLLPMFAFLTILSATGTVILTRWLEHRDIFSFLHPTALYQYIQTHFAGIFLSMMFFFGYFVLAQTLNFPDHRTLDLYFDTDISEWITRLTANPSDVIPSIRAVHPAVMLILRPCVWLVSLLLNGNQLQAIFILSALAGAGCVFLVWVIVKRISNTTYALIMASLLGAGTSHLLLSSMLETYIFSSLALISFVLLLQIDRTSLKWTIPMGVLIFGITITNLVQACILYFFKQPRLKLIFTFIVAVVTATLILNLIQVRLFPSAEPVYNPGNLQTENTYRYNLFETPWRFAGRVNLISRAILLYGIVAPEPFVLTDELGTEVPNFRTFQITIGNFYVAGYRGIGDITIKVWMAILTLAALLWTINFFKSPRENIFSFSLILCLGFSFVLHTLYGDDPMLYSPNWVYALVLFVAFAFRKWADNRWLQIVLVIFLGMVIYTNFGLIHQIMAVSLPYYGR